MNKEIFKELKELLSHKKRKVNFIMEECDEDREVFITLLRKEINEKGYELISEYLYDGVIYEMDEDEREDGEKRIYLSMGYKYFEDLLEKLEK